MKEQVEREEHKVSPWMAAIECTWMGKIFLRIEGKKKRGGCRISSSSSPDPEWSSDLKVLRAAA